MVKGDFISQKIRIYFFLHYDPNLAQTQILTLVLNSKTNLKSYPNPNLNPILNIEKANKKCTNEYTLFLF